MRCVVQKKPGSTVLNFRFNAMNSSNQEIDPTMTRELKAIREETFSRFIRFVVRTM